MLALGGEHEAGADILRLQFRIVSKYFGLRSTGREPIQDIVNRDAQAALQGLPPRLPGSIVIRSRVLIGSPQCCAIYTSISYRAGKGIVIGLT